MEAPVMWKEGDKANIPDRFRDKEYLQVMACLGNLSEDDMILTLEAMQESRYTPILDLIVVNVVVGEVLPVCLLACLPVCLYVCL